MTYERVQVVRHGGPEVLQVVEDDLRPPAAGEVRIRVLAAPVSRPDVTARRGEALYSGTPLGQKPPFVPGYAVIGDVDAVGDGVRPSLLGERVGALTVTGGYAEYLYWRSDRLIPVPRDLDPAEAAPLILNYVVAYQVMHRSAKVATGERVLVIGASGGIGTALLQLGRLVGLRMYAVASKSKHDALTAYGAIPIDYRTQDFVECIREREPAGLDAVFDGMTRVDDVRRGLSLLRRGGRWVSFGEPDGFPTLLRMLGTLLAVNVLPNGRSLTLYGTSTYFFGGRRPFLQDWATLFRLLQQGAIEPIIARGFAILEAAEANALLESGQVVGNVVLVAPQAA